VTNLEDEITALKTRLKTVEDELEETRSRLGILEDQVGSEDTGSHDRFCECLMCRAAAFGR
jgi:predicted  nucleic acid-binding Zn-ribbon protein